MKISSREKLRDIFRNGVWFPEWPSLIHETANINSGVFRRARINTFVLTLVTIILVDFLSCIFVYFCALTFFVRSATFVLLDEETKFFHRAFLP